jgi:sporulation protein YlmC with PRC-barrel domain
MTETTDRLQGRLDGLLHLMDRQLIDVDGLFLGKVDDIELTAGDEGITITALLTGASALLGRLGGRLGDELITKWGQARPAEPGRTRPWRLTMDLVERLDSAVHLKVRRDELLSRDGEGLRLGSLAGMTVLEPDGDQAGHVLDARFEADPAGRLVLRSLLVGRGGPGSLLGYDRRREQGPRLLAALVRLWHRDTRVVEVDDADIDWTLDQVRLRHRLRDAGKRALDV